MSSAKFFPRVLAIILLSTFVATVSLAAGMEELKFKSIRFIGNQQIKTSTLLNAIATKKAKPAGLSFLDGQAKYDPVRLTSDMDLIRKLYQRQGYLDIVVKGYSLELEDGGLALTYEVEEGSVYNALPAKISSQVPQINAEGLKLDREYSRFTRLYSGINDDAILEQIIKRASLTPDFYAYDVRFNFEKDSAAHTAGIELQIVPASPIVIERIEVSGNVKTQDNVISREFLHVGLEEGAIMSPPAYRLAIAEAYHELAKLGFLNSINISLRH